MRVLDIATGTGLSAESALAAVGPTGHVTAADISPAMAGKARERLGKAPDVLVSIEDGQALSFSDESFDAVLCNLGLMFFSDPVRGLSEFRRVLRPGRRAAVSVNTVVERSYNHQINVMITRYVPSLMYRAWLRPSLAPRAAKPHNYHCSSMRLALLTSRPIRGGTPSCCRRSTPIMVPLNAVALPPVRRWPHFPRKYAAPYAKRCGAAWLTLAG